MSQENAGGERGGRGGLVAELQERAKELNCLYRIEELLSHTDRPLEEVFQGVAEAIPLGWQYPDVCHAAILYDGRRFESPGFVEGACEQKAELVVQGQKVGTVCVGYSEPMPSADFGPFLKEEVKLIETIAERLSHFVLHKSLKEMFERQARTNGYVQEGVGPLKEWQVALDLLRKTDSNLYHRISRKMMNYMCWSGIPEAQELLQRYGQEHRGEVIGETNQPAERTSLANLSEPADETFDLADRSLTDEEILAQIQKWIHEDRASSLVSPLLNIHSSWNELHDALRRFQHHRDEGIQLSGTQENGVRVSLIKRFFSDQLAFVNVAKKYVEIDDFLELLDRIVFPSSSHGKLGGKAAGLFLASKVLSKCRQRGEDVGEVRVPKTWYLTSDGLIDFLSNNNLEEAYERKYQDVEKIRQDYPQLIQVFKNSSFSQEVVKGISMALDDLEDVPLIVRSSSLLEDRLGSAFSGKYKSLFLSNQGSKQERLDALLDAIAEVYASTFGPDPIEYRAEKGLLDFDEEMGILIQPVVGDRVGRYFFASFAGVALTKNEFRWSPRIRREDGLTRLVAGLGTRAVDRTEDYPVLVAPGQPHLRANVSVDEVIRYSPKKMDVINLDARQFETVDITEILAHHGDDYPGIDKIVSIHDEGMMRRPIELTTDFSKDDLVVTFEGLTGGTSFCRRMRNILRSLHEALGTPVDIEFASTGKDFHLLQCRPQSHSGDQVPVVIPRNVPDDDVVFTAHRYVSNGKVPDLTHIVYVDPDEYSELPSRSEMLAVGRGVSKLNKMLPKRQFILMGPGRWGSRGDIKLGVTVTYADINNTAMLVEIARKKGNYLPDLSFGTHFFQDLVEASIRYLPLYPDDEGVVFNESLLCESPNLLAEMIPELGSLGRVLRVIDVPQVTGGRILRVLMNAKQDEALAMLADPSVTVSTEEELSQTGFRRSDDHWRWRLRMAERIGAQMEAEKLGVEALYVFGSTKNATAGPGSDIDLLIHFAGDEDQRRSLMSWLEGWSRCLAEMNFLRTGYRTDELLDVHLLSDEDIRNQTSFAVKIGAVTDAARRIPLRSSSS